MSATEIGHLIDGSWDAGSGAALLSENPSRPEETVGTGTKSTAEDVARAVGAANRASDEWRRTPAHERGAVLTRVAATLEAHADEWGAELAREEGKTIAEGIGEVRRAGQIFRYYSQVGDQDAGGLFNSPRRGERILVTRRPLGTVGIITPFNFPIAIPAWKIAPALAYGNAVVWKPASTVPLLAYRLAGAIAEAGIPVGVLNMVLGDSEVGSAIVEHPGVHGISFTGSTGVGRAIAEVGARRGIPVQAELGGKNAAIVLDDADLELAASQVIAGAFNSTGQKCTATSRLILHSGIASEFSRMVAEAADSLSVGDPLDSRVRLGPVITRSARSSIQGAITSALGDGARALTRRTLDLSTDLSQGYFVAPTILNTDDGGERLWTHEVFGPVLAVKTVATIDDAFALANASEFGLSAAVFTRDLATALAAVDDIDVGMLHINSETAGADPHVPFGGVKGSGLGPKEQGLAAREFYSRTTTVYLQGGV